VTVPIRSVIDQIYQTISVVNTLDPSLLTEADRDELRRLIHVLETMDVRIEEPQDTL